MVVFGVGANPEPNQNSLFFDRHSAVMNTDPHRPHAPDLLEVQGWMARIVSKKPIALSRQLLDILRKPPKILPEPRVRSVLHSSVVRPAWRSAMASFARSSNFPANTSSSNC